MVIGAEAQPSIKYISSNIVGIHMLDNKTINAIVFFIISPYF